MASAPANINKAVDFDTGFPVSFAFRTTSLRHPEANTAPGVSMTAEDINPIRTQQQPYKPLLRKAKQTIGRAMVAFEAPVPQKDSNFTVAPTTMDPYFDKRKNSRRFWEKWLPGGLFNSGPGGME
ncbi:WD domain-containing protein [Apiospora arundinis]